MVQISIIVPVYNVSDFLVECIESVITQTYMHFEVILVDDGSTDNSGIICDKFAKSDTRVHVIHQRNRGLSAARNAAIAIASGEYIIFLDSDDVWNDENVLKALAERIEETTPDVLSFNFIKFDNHREYEPYFAAESLSVQSRHTLQSVVEQDLWIACAWNKAIRRELFKNGALRFVEGITSEDMDWCVRLALEANQFDYLNLPVVRYRQRESSISRNSTPKKVGFVMGNIRSCLALIENNNSDKAELLKPYIGYQYGTVLFHLACVSSSKEKDELIKQADDLRYLLKWSKNRKVRVLDLVISVVGVRFTLLLLKQIKGLL